MQTIWTYADKTDLGLELLTIGRRLADQLHTALTAVLTGDENSAQEFINCGADNVLLLPPLETNQPVQDYVPIIAKAALKEPPGIFLVSASLAGKEMAARIAVHLEAGLCTECQNLTVTEDEIVHMERMIYGGAWIQTLRCLSQTQMATIPPHSCKRAVSKGERKGTITRLFKPEPSGIKIMEKRNRDSSSGNIRDARVLVCAGRGVENVSDLKMVKELADILNGETACTRPLAEEKHWMAEEKCIGLSAHDVKPDIYIGIGVSGQIQHLVGLRDAGIICAVNSDEKAPIFEAADFGIHGDLYKIIPLLIEELNK